jgi:hypothetical protein
MRVNRVVIDSSALHLNAVNGTSVQLKAIRIGHSNMPLPKCFHFKRNLEQCSEQQYTAAQSISVSQQWFTDGFSHQAQSIVE